MPFRPLRPDEMADPSGLVPPAYPQEPPVMDASGLEAPSYPDQPLQPPDVAPDFRVPFDPERTSPGQYQLPPATGQNFRGWEPRPSALRPLTPRERESMAAPRAQVRMGFEEPQVGPTMDQTSALLRQEADRPIGEPGAPLDAIAPRPAWEGASTVRQIVDPLRTGVVGVRTSGLGLRAATDASVIESIDHILAGGTPRRGNQHDGNYYGEDPALLRQDRAALVSKLQQTAQTHENLNQTLEAETLAAPRSVQGIMQAGERGDTMGVLRAFWQDPGSAMAFLGLSSAPYSGVMAAGGLAGGAVGAGVASGLLEYGSSVMDRLREHWGVDTRDSNAVAQALANPAILSEVRNFASMRGGPIGAFDAMSFGGTAHGFRQMAHGVGRQSALRTFGEGVRETVTGTAREGFMGGAGEAAAQFATGSPFDPGQIFAEAAGEAASAPVSVAGAAVRGLRQGYQDMQGAPMPAPQPIVPPAPNTPNLAGGLVQPVAPTAAPAQDDGVANTSPAFTGPATAPPAVSAAAAPVAPPQPPQPIATAGEVSQAQLEDLLNDPTPLPEIKAQEQATQEGQAAAAQEAIERQATAAGVPAIGAPSTVTFADGGSEQASVVSITQGENGKPIIRIRTADGIEQDIGEGEATFGPPIKGDGTAAAPVVADSPAAIEQAETQVAPAPTPAQAEAENYPVGHLKLHGLDLSIETATGGTRSGTGPDGQPWSVQMPVPYGRILRTTGADGDHLDFFLGPQATDRGTPVFIIDQFDPATGRFDEHKAMIGFPSIEAATAAYDASFSDGSGPRRRVAARRMAFDNFRQWAMNRNLRLPASDTGRQREQQAIAAEAKAKQEAEAAQNAPLEDNARRSVIERFAEHFQRGNGFRTITEAQTAASEILGRPVKAGTQLAKDVEEAIEGAVAVAARRIVRNAADDTAYQELIDLYDRQPILGTRTGDSVARQAYSTPAPLAFLAQRALGNPRGMILEPTAGTGMLLTTFKSGRVIANEIDPARRAIITDTTGIIPTDKDATTADWPSGIDAVIANPPFGTVDDKNGPRGVKSFDTGYGWKTSQIDHAIALRALKALEDGGRGVLLVAAPEGRDEKNQEARARGYKTGNSLKFWRTLHENFDVMDHFTVSGSLYRRQGAEWPIDVIVVRKVGDSASRHYPGTVTPPVFSTWEELWDGTRTERIAERQRAAERESPAVGSGSGKPAGSRGAGAGGGKPDAGPVSTAPDAAGSGNDQPGGKPGGVSDTGGTGRPGMEPDGNAVPQPGDNGPQSEPVVHGSGAGADGDGGNPPQPAGGEGGVPTLAPGGVGGSGTSNASGGLTESDFDGLMSDIFGAPQPTSTAPSPPSAPSPRSPSGPRTSPAPKPAGGGMSQDDALAGLWNALTTKPQMSRFDEDLYVKPGGVRAMLTGFAATITDAAKDALGFARQIIMAMKDWLTRQGITAVEQMQEFINNLKQYVIRFVNDRDKTEETPTPQTERPARGQQTQDTETDLQVAYEPQSKAEGVGTLVPKNMASASKAWLTRLEGEVGNLDAYVANRLGYTEDEVTGDDERAGYFSAEQVDALASAIHWIEQGKGFIIGDQCVAGGTRIYDPVTNTHTPIKALAERGRSIPVLAMTPNGLRLATAFAPFKKGTADLYEVVMDDGRRITVTAHHRFLTPDGWQRAGALLPGSLLACAEGPPAKSLGCAPSVHIEDGPHSTETVQGSFDRCFACSHPCGEPLHANGDSAPSPSPSPGDAQAHIRPWSHEGGQETSRGHNHPRPDFDRPARSGSSPWESRDLSMISGPIAASGASRSLSIPLGGRPFRGGTGGLLEEGDAVLVRPSEPSGRGWLLRVSGAASSDVPSGDHTGWRRIVSITHAGRDEFFDMWVPGYENYVAEGVINHNTGVGKGRFVAGMIRYGLRTGKTPIFMTQNPALYSDIFRDLYDINEFGVKPFVTNRDLKGKDAIPLPPRPGEEVSSGAIKTAGPKAYAEIIERGKLGDEFNVVFTTYPQTNPGALKPDAPWQQRREFLRKVAENGILVMDESHEAVGTAVATRTSSKKGTPRSDWFRKNLIPGASGVVFSSATLAKTPRNWGLYAPKTSMMAAVDNTDTLIRSIDSGGVPLQQAMTAGLAEAGQYLRRERSFDGVTVETNELPVRDEDTLALVENMRKLFSFDAQIMEGVREAWAEDNTTEGDVSTGDNAVGQTATEGANFASMMHNLVGQALLSIKVKEVAALVIDAARRGEKPLIAVSNTMGAILGDVLEQTGIKADATIKPMNFGEVMARYVERMKRVGFKDPRTDNIEYHWLTDDEINAYSSVPDAAAKLAQLEEAVRHHAGLAPFSASPLDLLHYHLKAAGLRVGELTGRGVRIEFMEDPDKKDALAYVRARDPSSAEKKRTMNAFNAGDLDAIILNRSGSTGFSLHASAKFKDQRQRHMFILQAEPDINLFMQILGRIHRTGQVVLPMYTVAMSDIPAERRQASQLVKKLGSLNANTTASRQGGFQLQARDVINAFGDRAFYAWLREHSDIADIIDVHAFHDDKGNAQTNNLASRASGRFLLLTPKQQREAWDWIDQEYDALIEEADRLGTNNLEARTIDLEAEALNESTVQQGKADSQNPFERPVVLRKVSAKRTGRAMTQDQRDKAISDWHADNSEGENNLLLTWISEAEAEQGRQFLRLEAEAATVEAELKEFQENNPDEADGSPRLGAFTRRLTALTLKRLALEETPSALKVVEAGDTIEVGQYYTLKVTDKDEVTSMTAQLIGIVINPRIKSQLSLSRYVLRYAIADAGRTMDVSLARFFGAPNNRVEATVLRDQSLVDLEFEAAQGVSRNDRYIYGGNILAAYTKAREARGVHSAQLVLYTTKDGTIEQGVLMGQRWKPDAAAAGPATFKNPMHVGLFLNKVPTSIVRSGDGVMTISKIENAYGNQYVINVNRGGAKDYVSMRGVKRFLAGDFVAKRGGAFRAEIAGLTNLDSVVDFFQKEGVTWQTKENQAQARAITGEPDPLAGMREAAKPQMSLFGEAEARVKAGGTIKPEVIKAFEEHIRRITGGRTKFRAGDGRWGAGYSGTGLYQAGMISIALNASENVRRRAINHEVIHALKDLGLFTADEWARLRERAKDWRRDLGIDGVYALDRLTEEQLDGEAIAEAYAQWSNGKPLAGDERFKGLFTRIGEFFRRLAAALRRHPTWGHNVSDIWEKVASGEVGAREAPMEHVERIVKQRLVAELGLDAARAQVLSQQGRADYERTVAEMAKPQMSRFGDLLRTGRLSPEEKERITVLKDPKAKDVSFLHEQFQRPKELFAREPALKTVWNAADRAITKQHTWVKRFTDEYEAAWRKVPKSARDEVGRLLFAGDAEEVVWNKDELRDMGASEAAISGYENMREMFGKLGRFIDQHRLAMVPYLRKRRDWLMSRIGEVARKQEKEANSLLNRRNILVQRARAGTGDPTQVAADIEAIDAKLQMLVSTNSMAEFERMMAELDMVQGRLADTAIRNRKTGYVPHRFFGSWQVYRVSTDEETGDRSLELVAGPQGFFLDRPSAVEAAKAALKANPDGDFLVRPKVAGGFAGPQGVEMADASFWKLAGEMADEFQVSAKEGADMLRERGIARPTSKRRTASFLKKRVGTEGYSKDFERVMVAHIIESVRYVVMDRFKHTAESSLEQGGFSRHQPNRDMGNLQRAVLKFMDDVYGYKQSSEASIDRLLTKGSPLTAAATMAAAAGTPVWLAGGGIPLALMVGGFFGHALWKARRGSPDFASRGVMNYVDTVVTHIKLGLVLNWISGVRNSTQTAINTYPVLGSKWTAEGMQAAINAWWMRHKEGSEGAKLWRLMLRAGVVSQADYTEVNKDEMPLHSGMGAAAGRASLWMFRTAESANRATAFLGAYLKAKDDGQTEARSMAYAREIMDLTQHRYDAAYKPALARQQVLRPFLKFKSFILQQTLFALGLAKGNIPQPDATVDGRKFPPAFWKMLTLQFLIGGVVGAAGMGVIDDIWRLLRDDPGPLSMVKEWGRSAINNNPDMAYAIDAFVYGLPAIVGQNFAVGAGMGEKFIPTRLGDWRGPAWDTIRRMTQLGSHSSSGLGDYMLALSTPLGRPFKVLEAEANGMPLWTATRPEWWAAVRDDRFDWVNPTKAGRTELDQRDIAANPGLWWQLFAGSAPLALAKMYDQAELSRTLTEQSKQEGQKFGEAARMALRMASGNTQDETYKQQIRQLLIDAAERGYAPANPRATIRNIERDFTRNRNDRTVRNAPVNIRPRLEEARP